MQKILYVGIGGFLGASLRYMVSLNASKLFGTYFPFGTLIVNVCGGLFIGILMTLSLSTNMISGNLKLFLIPGILGGLTTFSTFSYETMNLFFNESYSLAAVNLLLNVILSFLGVWFGKLIIQCIFI